MDAEVLVHQNVAQADNILPWHQTVSVLDFGTQLGNGLSNRRKPLCDRVAKRLISHEVSFGSARYRPRDPVESF
jgi:hypothetical protein